MITVYVPVLHYGKTKTAPTVLSAKFYGSLKQMRQWEPKAKGYVKFFRKSRLP